MMFFMVGVGFGFGPAGFPMLLFAPFCGVIAVIFVLVIFVFFVNALFRHGVLESLLFSVALAVAAQLLVRRACRRLEVDRRAREWGFAAAGGPGVAA